MPFISSNTAVLAFADYYDVVSADQRLFESNEGLTEESVEDLLIRSTDKLVSKLSSRIGKTIDPMQILTRQDDFTDLCVYYCLHYYILPKFADFGSEENAEVQKMGYYQNKYELLFNELVSAGDWYDLDDDGVIEETDSIAAIVNLKRVR